MTVFLVENLNVFKGAKHVMVDVSLTAHEGEVVVILGENGAGKSILLRSAACIESGATGKVQLAHDVFHLPIESGQSGPWPSITLGFQHLALWPHLSGRENVLLPWQLATTARRMPEAELEWLFGRMDLSPLLAKLPSEMSGGERQRIAIARAVALRPQVLLLDEPSSALDARHAIDLSDLLNELKKRGTIIICATHNLGFGARIADRFLFVEQGKIIAGGPWNELAATRHEAVQAFLSLNAFKP
jgi:ABC-type polar amino acid transport system ATPase subunit